MNTDFSGGFSQIVLKKWHSIFKDHITLGDYEIGNGSSIEMYYS